MGFTPKFTVCKTFPQFNRVADLIVEAVRVLHPLHKRCVEGEVTLHGLTHGLFVDLVGRHGQRQYRSGEEE